MPNCKFLPYGTQLIFLMEFFNHYPNPKKDQKESLEIWFWKTTYSNYFTICSLTDQRKAYEEVVMNDLSYAELARLEGISRQGAYDMIRRCDKQLEEYEAKLRLVERFLVIKDRLQEIEDTAKELQEITGDGKAKELVEQIRRQSGDILEQL